MRLRFREDHTFRIVQLTDLHIGAKPYVEEDYQTFALIDAAFSKLDADLVVITGDLIWSDGVTDAIEVYRDVLEKFNQYQIPVAITYGNHDAEDEFLRSDMRKLENLLHNHAPKMNSLIINDRECYNLEIYDSEGRSLESVFYVFDSGAEAPLEVGKYDWIQSEQVNWFNEISVRYRPYLKEANNLVFLHIPLPEYWQAAQNIVSGECNETNDMISAPYINTGLFASLYLNSLVSGVFCGHDHDNNFVGLHHGIQLVYGQVSGYNCYGDLPRGVRVIELGPEGMNTYTKTMEDF